MTMNSGKGKLKELKMRLGNKSLHELIEELDIQSYIAYITILLEEDIYPRLVRLEKRVRELEAECRNK